jgi:hypothetical protein
VHIGHMETGITIGGKIAKWFIPSIVAASFDSK